MFRVGSHCFRIQYCHLSIVSAWLQLQSSCMGLCLCSWISCKQNHMHARRRHTNSGYLSWYYIGNKLWVFSLILKSLYSYDFHLFHLLINTLQRTSSHFSGYFRQESLIAVHHSFLAVFTRIGLLWSEVSSLTVKRSLSLLSTNAAVLLTLHTVVSCLGF